MMISIKPPLNPPHVKIGENIINYVTKVVSLGLTVSCDLSWEAHIFKICQEIKQSLFTLWKSQKITPQKTRIHLVRTLLAPRFLYCSNIFMGCSRSCWDRVERTFNMCVRYAFKIRKHKSVSMRRKTILNCELENFIKYRACVFLFLLQKTKTPSYYLYEQLFFPRFRRNNLLSVPNNRRTEQINRSFFVLGVKLWNSLSPELRNTESTLDFKRNCLSYFASLKT